MTETTISTTETTTTTRVLYVYRRDAKAVKTALERHGKGRLLDRRYRLTPAIAAEIAEGCGRRPHDGPLPWRVADSVGEDGDEAHRNRRRTAAGNGDDDDDIIAPEILRRCVAVPVTRECFEVVRRRLLLDRDRDGGGARGEDDEADEDDEEWEWTSRVVGVGRQHCPPSPAATASKRKGQSRVGGPAAGSTSASAGGVREEDGRREKDYEREEEEALHEAVDSMTLVQRAIYETLVRRGLISPSSSSRMSKMDLCRSILSLDSKVCPTKLERLGDDTLVLPGKALLSDGNTDGSRALRSLLLRFATVDDGTDGAVAEEESSDTSPSDTSPRNADDRRGDGNDENEASKASSSPHSRSSLRQLCHSVHREIVRLCNDDSHFGGCGGGGKATSAARCRRLARRGEIDPDSPTRRSGHVILYHVDYDYDDCMDGDGDCDDGCGSRSLEEVPRGKLAPDRPTGPGSPGWITIKEYGIRQSFDLTRVMFSRGNVTEKRRFGSNLVRRGEVVLDMYAGIGYYTLPALILGGASHVIACEWNPDAAFALRHNLRDNGVEVTSASASSASASSWASSVTAGNGGGRGRATVLQGDCRVTCREFGVVDSVDRVNLGLLPSSEGGWTTAVRALRNDRGGWVHVHGNVPSDEREMWAAWVCGELVERADGVGRRGRSSSGGGRCSSGSGWVALCGHVERVKSYAPRVDHLVADIYVGPADSCPPELGGGESSGDGAGGEVRAGFLRPTGEFVPSPESSTVRPSCALCPGGVLHQKWMMEDTSSRIDG